MNTRILDTFVQFKVRFPSFSEHWLATSNEMTSFKLSTVVNGKKIRPNQNLGFGEMGYQVPCAGPM